MAIGRSTSRDLAQIAIFTALIAALGAPGTIKVGTTGVPITFQTLGVMLAGAILGARKGFLAVMTFEVLTFAGLPLLAGSRGGHRGQRLVPHRRLGQGGGDGAGGQAGTPRLPGADPRPASAPRRFPNTDVGAGALR